MRLQLPEGHAGLQTWNMPTPPGTPIPHYPDTPELSQDFTFTAGERFYYEGVCKDHTRFCAARLDEVTGLTFWKHDGMLITIHCHTPTSPYAELPAWYLDADARVDVYPIYVPLASGDRVRTIRTRPFNEKPIQILVRPIYHTL
jgi:hypothetical protein